RRDDLESGGVQVLDVVDPGLVQHLGREVVHHDREAVDLDDAVPVSGLVERHPERGSASAAAFAPAPSARPAAATASAAAATTAAGLKVDTDRHSGLLTLHQAPDLVLRL